MVSVSNGYSDPRIRGEIVANICKPFVATIRQITQSSHINKREDSTTKRQHIHKLIQSLEKLAVIVKHISPATPESNDHIVSQVIRELWSDVESLMASFYVSNGLTKGRISSDRVAVQVREGVNEKHVASVQPVSPFLHCYDRQ